MTSIYTASNVSSASKEADDFFSDVCRGNIHEADDNSITEVALSVIWQRNQLGAAYYVFDTEHLYLMTDHSETAPLFTVLRLLLKQIQPNFIITSCKADEKVVSILKDACIRSSTTSSNISERFLEMQKVILLPNIDFAYESCRHHLQNLNIPGIPPNMNDAERRIYFASLIDFTSTCMVKAAGGLMKFVGKKSLSDSLSVSAISSFSLNNIVNIDDNTYRVLQIFQDERHPSVYKSTVGVKEGLSLYGICNKCKSSIGKKELKRWFLLPTNDLSIIRERHKAINFFSLSKNLEIVNAIQSSLKFIKYLPRIFLRMKMAQASLNDWKSLYKTSYHAMLIGEICRAHSSSVEIFKEISDAFTADLFRVASLLDKIIDFDEYARQNHFAVKPGVDNEIDKMKRTYQGLPDFMTQVAHQELQDLHTDIQQCTVIYLPQLGYLLAVPMTDHMKETKDYTLPNLRYMFVLNDTVHYKSARTSNLDSLLGDTLCDIYDKETQIMHKLQDMVLEMKNVFFSVMDLLAKLDCLISLSVVSKEFNWVQPEISNDETFAVLKARHPLQELCVPSFVANDIFSGSPNTNIKVLTGPNSSGKSTYLKEVALLSFLGHIGCFVPAQKAKIPLLDSIFSCIENVESVSINLSSFLISLNQLSSCLNYSSRKSLVVVDEFGKHTDGMSGLALLIGSLGYWAQKGVTSPHVFLATHYLSLNNYVPATPHLAYQTVDMIMNEELVVFHQLVDGIATSSYATHTALQAGVPERIVQRSLEITNDIKCNQPISILESSFPTQKVERYLSIYKAFMELDVDCEEDVEHFLDFMEKIAQE